MPQTQILLAAAISSLTLSLFVPPMRRFNPFIETIEAAIRQTVSYAGDGYEIVRRGLVLLWNRMLRRFGLLAPVHQA